MFEKYAVKFVPIKIDGDDFLVKELSAGDMQTILEKFGDVKLAKLTEAQDIAITAEIVAASLFTADKQRAFATADELKSLNPEGAAVINGAVMPVHNLGGVVEKKPSQRRRKS